MNNFESADAIRVIVTLTEDIDLLSVPPVSFVVIVLICPKSYKTVSIAGN